MYLYFLGTSKHKYWSKLLSDNQVFLVVVVLLVLLWILRAPILDPLEKEGSIASLGRVTPPEGVGLISSCVWSLVTGNPADKIESDFYNVFVILPDWSRAAQLEDEHDHHGDNKDTLERHPKKKKVWEYVFHIILHIINLIEIQQIIPTTKNNAQCPMTSQRRSTCIFKWFSFHT